MLKNFKKVMSLAVAACMLICTAGCSNPVNNTGSNEDAEFTEGVIATYKIETEDYTEEELEQTVNKMFERAKAYCKEWNYSIEDDRITFEIPMDTEDADVEEMLKGLAMSGELLFLDEENYDAWTFGREYEAILTGENIDTAVGTTNRDSMG